MSDRIPSYRRKKTKTWTYAVVTLPDGAGGRRDVLLGHFGTPESKAAYARTIAEWQANGGHLSRISALAASQLSVAEVLLRYWTWATDYYRGPDGQPTRELENLPEAIRPLRRLYASRPAADFGPLQLRTIQDGMIAAGLARRTINTRIGRIKRLFRWAVSFGLVPATVHHGLESVPGLRRGRSGAREGEPVRPVADNVVDKTIRHVLPPVAAMVELQRLTGMRPGEVCIMRECDLDLSGPIWTYIPEKHKNTHRDKQRIVALGPRAQAVIKPFLSLDTQAYLFSPQRALTEARAEKRRQRKSKVPPSQQNRRSGIRSDGPPSATTRTATHTPSRGPASRPACLTGIRTSYGTHTLPSSASAMAWRRHKSHSDTRGQTSLRSTQSETCRWRSKSQNRSANRQPCWYAVGRTLKSVTWDAGSHDPVASELASASYSTRRRLGRCPHLEYNMATFPTGVARTMRPAWLACHELVAHLPDPSERDDRRYEESLIRFCQWANDVLEAAVNAVRRVADCLGKASTVHTLVTAAQQLYRLCSPETPKSAEMEMWDMRRFCLIAPQIP